MMKKISLCVLAIALLFTVVSCKPNPAIGQTPGSDGTTLPQGVTQDSQSGTGTSAPQGGVVKPTATKKPAPGSYKGPLVPHSADNVLFYHGTQEDHMESMAPALELYVSNNSQKMDRILNALRSGQKVTDQVGGEAEITLCVSDSNIENNPYYRNYYRLYRLDSQILFTADHFPNQVYQLSGDKSGVIRDLLEEHYVLGEGKVLTEYTTYSGMIPAKDQGVGIKKVTDTTELKEFLARKNMSIDDIDLKNNALIRMSFNPDSFSMKYSIARLAIEDGRLVAYANTYAPSGGKIDSIVAQVIYIVVPQKDIAKVSGYTYRINDFVGQ